jgi:hypothetical protein
MGSAAGSGGPLITAKAVVMPTLKVHKAAELVFYAVKRGLVVPE